MIEPGSWSCLIVPGIWRIVFTFSRICDVWSLTTSRSPVWVRRPVVCPRKTFTTLLVFEVDVLPVFYCRHYGDISIFFCLFVWPYLCEQDVVLCPCRVYNWTKFTDTLSCAWVVHRNIRFTFCWKFVVSFVAWFQWYIGQMMYRIGSYLEQISDRFKQILSSFGIYFEQNLDRRWTYCRQTLNIIWSYVTSFKQVLNSFEHIFHIN